ncbi:MAG: hypothetical protein J7M12_05735 [Candidatus Hydrogenedentes bacterium]|nr:hypothetical protein [Candidatus Hydrogenedentota bacterium]
MGVRRALNLTLDSAFGRGSRLGSGDRRMCTLGPLIHNSQVVSLLREYGIEQT